MTIRHLSTALVGLALGLVPVLPASAESRPATIAAIALGDEGQLYEVTTGPFGELFPEDVTLPADTPVLALDVVQPDGTRQRTIVPGSDGPEVEGALSVVFEDASGRLYTVWESKKTPTVSRLLLASFGATGWSEPIEISGDVSPLKDEPRVLIGRDRFARRNASGEQSSRSRTAIHVAWREEGPDGRGLYYTPVILEAGRYVGWNPVVALAELESEAPQPEPGSEASELLRAPELAAGQDIHSAIIGFLSPTSGRLVTVESRLLPGEIGFLGDDIRGDIIEIGNRDREELAGIAKKCRDEVVQIGKRLNPAVVGHFADRVRGSVLQIDVQDPNRPIEAVADDIRGDIIEIGAQLFGGPGGQGQVKKLLEVGSFSAAQAGAPSGPAVTHLVLLRAVSERPEPPLDGVPAKIFVSEDGERVLVGWISKGKVYYTETVAEPGSGGEAWAAVKHMTLTERLGISEAAAILEARVRRRR